MSLSVKFLGTSASRPTVERNVASLAVTREGETMLIDCGEGTQRQMMRYGITFAMPDVFFTHLHADHLLGIAGLVRTMALQGRTEVMRLYGPPGSRKLLQQAVMLGSDKKYFPIEYIELKPDVPIKRNAYSILPFPVDHAGTTAFGYALIEEDRLGRFNPDLAREMGIPEGPLWGQIHKGEAIKLDDGRVIEPSVLVGAKRQGRKVVITGDCRPSATTIQIAENADLLIHEATFAIDEAQRALETGHSTANEAAQVAKMANVKQLVLTHLSARYSRDARELESEAKAVFENSVIARDGMELTIPHSDSSE